MSLFDLGMGRVLIEIGSYVTTASTQVYFRLAGVRFGQGLRCWGMPLVRRHRKARIVIGARCFLRNWFSANEMGIDHRSFLSARYPDAELLIGDDLRASGVVICAEQSVRIGNRVTVGANSTIVDSDFHPLNPNQRALDPKAGQKAGVVIGDDIFIGMNCTILKGTEIGDNCIVGAGSVVSGQFPAGSVIAGNPAQVIRENDTA